MLEAEIEASGLDEHAQMQAVDHCEGVRGMIVDVVFLHVSLPGKGFQPSMQDCGGCLVRTGENAAEGGCGIGAERQSVQLEPAVECRCLFVLRGGRQELQEAVEQSVCRVQLVIVDGEVFHQAEDEFGSDDPVEMRLRREVVAKG